MGTLPWIVLADADLVAEHYLLGGDCVANRVNQEMAGRLEEAAGLLRDQGADPLRVGAYLRAAATLRSTPEPVDEMFRTRGLDGLKELPHIGESIARAIRELLTHGRLPMLDRLRLT